MYDLHLHSQRSDGQLTPLALAEHLIGLNAKGFAITDHNYMAADLPYVKDYTTSMEVDFISGIEISSMNYDTGVSWHVLGYGNQIDCTLINQKLAGVRDGYNRRAKNIIDKLNRAYPEIDLDFDRLKDESLSSYLDRNRIAQELQNYLDDGRSIRDLLPEVFVEESEDWMPTVTEAIQLILFCGGLPVLAHPGRQADRDRTTFKKFLEQLAGAGLVGLEVYYAKHDTRQIEYLKKVAKQHELLATGGSDWHGPNFSAGKNPGSPLPETDFKKLAQRLTHPFSS